MHLMLEPVQLRQWNRAGCGERPLGNGGSQEKRYTMRNSIVSCLPEHLLVNYNRVTMDNYKK